MILSDPSTVIARHHGIEPRHQMRLTVLEWCPPAESYYTNVIVMPIEQPVWEMVVDMESLRDSLAK